MRVFSYHRKRETRYCKNSFNIIKRAIRHRAIRQYNRFRSFVHSGWVHALIISSSILINNNARRIVSLSHTRILAHTKIIYLEIIIIRRGFSAPPMSVPAALFFSDCAPASRKFIYDFTLYKRCTIKSNGTRYIISRICIEPSLKFWQTGKINTKHR